MKSPNDRPLPVSFWNDIDPADRAAAGLPAIPDTQPDPVQELESWRASFFELGGLSVEDAMTKYYGTPYKVNGTPMYTYEQVFKQAQLDFVNAVDEAKQRAQEDPKASKRQATTTRNVALHAANEEWREAVRQRKEAMIAWDNYVTEKRLAFQRLKNS